MSRSPPGPPGAQGDPPRAQSQPRAAAAGARRLRRRARERAAAAGPGIIPPDGFRNPPGSPERGGDFGDWSSFFLRRFDRARRGRAAGRPRPARGRGAGRRGQPAQRSRPPDLARPCELPAAARRPHHPDRPLSRRLCLAAAAARAEALRAARSAGRSACRRSTCCCCRTTTTTTSTCRRSRRWPARTASRWSCRSASRAISASAATRGSTSSTGTSEQSAAGARDHGAAGDPLLQAHAVRSQPDALDRLCDPGPRQAGLFRRRYRLWAGVPGARPADSRRSISALLPIGAYEPRLLMQGSHATPEEALQIAPRARARAHGRHALGHDPPDRRAAVRAARALSRRGRRQRATPRTPPG